MFKWKDVTSSKLFSLTSKIKQKYGIEELINFYLSNCNQTFEEMKNDYEYGYGLKYISKNDYNLDHKRSIYDCYHDVLLPEQCANVNNLIVITAQENLSKNKHSSITKEELLFLIENNKM